MKTVISAALLACCLSGQMQNSAVASLTVYPVNGQYVLLQVGGQPNQYFEVWGMLGPTFLGAEYTQWGVVDIPIFLGTHIKLASGYISWNGITMVILNAPPGVVFSIQAIVGVNHWYYPIWWLTEACTLST